MKAPTEVWYHLKLTPIGEDKFIIVQVFALRLYW